jgi:hypothetical protein
VEGRFALTASEAEMPSTAAAQRIILMVSLLVSIIAT